MIFCLHAYFSKVSKNSVSSGLPVFIKKQTIIRQSSGSHLAVIRLSSGSRQASHTMLSLLILNFSATKPLPPQCHATTIFFLPVVMPILADPDFCSCNKVSLKETIFFFANCACKIHRF